MGSPKELDRKKSIKKNLKGIWKDFFVRSILLLSEILLTFLMQWILIYKVYEETPGPRALEWEINPMGIGNDNEAIFEQKFVVTFLKSLCMKILRLESTNSEELNKET